jgi:hypothetical protein
MKTKYFPILSPIIFILVTFISGLYSPGYNTLKHTISRLLIFPFGYIQKVNFFQFAISLVLSGQLISAKMKNESSKRFIRKSSYICFFLLTLTATFTPDNVENNLINFRRLTTGAILHIMLVLGFLLISPFGVYKLYNIFKSEKFYKNIAKFTLFMGYSSLTLSIIWIFFYYKGWFFDYKGIFEKVIAIWVIIWLEVVNYT